MATTKPAAKAQPTAKPETPAATLDLTTDLQALAAPRPYGAANARAVPPEVAKFVEDAHAAWRQNPYAWQAVTLSGPDAVEEVFQLARLYAARRGTPVTVQRKKTENPAELVYRVRDKIRQNRNSTPIITMTDPSIQAASPTEA